ncbi:MAG: hypothetical protein IJ775_03380 [Muribaculaceae bacterium]|nr:hypothetical protein [Muribaculaceae bacterium]
MNRIIAFLALAATTIGCWAMTEEEQSHAVWNALDNIMVEPDGTTALMYYQKTDVDNDGIDDLVLFNDDRATRRVLHAYSVGRNMNEISLTAAQIERISSERPSLIQYINSSWALPDDDITLKEPPIFISGMEKNKNEFIGWRDLANYPAGSLYTHMVFKPHVNEINFVRDDHIFTSLDGDTLWQDTREFKLKNPKVVATMFRGYSDGVAAPVAVTQHFLSTHKPQQFSRWLSPEPKRAMNETTKRIVIEHYGNYYRVAKSQWLATLPTPVGNRDYYMVLLAGKQKVIFAIVSLGEGMVASAIELVNDEKEEGEFSSDLSDAYLLDASDVDDLFDEHGPEIMCIMHTDLGLELYVRWNSMEGTHYSVWREVGTRMVNIIDEYHYWMFG